MNTTRKHLLIAGGTGFIGKRFVKKASESGYICHVISRTKHEDTDSIKYYQANLINMSGSDYENSFQDISFDGIVYMAANIPLMGAKKENYAEALHSTLVPFVNFAESTAKLCKNFVYISSIDCVGIPTCEYYNEDIELKPFTPYAVAKLAGEEYIKSIAQANSIKLSILRFSQVYGENEPIVRIIPLLIDCIKNDKEFNLYGTGLEKRRFLNVEDAVESILLALNSDKSGTYNIAGKSVDSIKDLIEITQKVFKKNLKINNISTSAKTFDNVPSIEKAKDILQFEPIYSLTDGIERIYHELQLK